MSQFFISGIGTGVGKTFTAAAMLHQNPHFRAIKPVLSGYETLADSDAGQLMQAMELSDSELDRISPFRFNAPLSPHLAAAKEGKAVDPEALLAFCRAQMAAHPDLLIEGVGGLYVPVTPDWLVINWMKALQLPVILVGASYLGAINHTLLSLQALKAANLSLQSLIISQSEECAGLEDTAASLKPFMPKGAQIVCVPRITDWKAAPDLLPSKA